MCLCRCLHEIRIYQTSIQERGTGDIFSHKWSSHPPTMVGGSMPMVGLCKLNCQNHFYDLTWIFPNFRHHNMNFMPQVGRQCCELHLRNFFSSEHSKKKKRSYHRLHLLIYKSPVLTKEVASKHVSINFSKYLALLLTRSLYFLWWKSPRTCYRYLNKGSLNASLLSHVPLILDINNLVWYVAMRFLRFSQR